MDTKNSLTKRLLAFVLAATMVLSLTACSDRTESSSPTDDSSISNPVSEPTTPATPGKPVEPEKDIADKISAAFNQNNDVVGWLSFPGTKIDNEVLQGDDNTFYERRDITKEYNWYGCYYADAGNTFGNRNDLSRNTVIYGHNMHNTIDGPKFGELQRLVDFNGDGTVFGDDVATATDISFAKEHPVLYFSTVDDEMVWVIYAAFFTEVGFDYHLENPDDKTFMNIVAEAKERSRLNYDVEVKPSDKILTLSACAYKYDNARRDQRFVVQARLLRPGEEIPTEAKVVKNPTPREPVFPNK